MLSLSSYLNNALSPLKLSKEDKQKLLALDKAYFDIFTDYKQGYDVHTVHNMDEEFKKFIEARQRGTKYYPVLVIGENRFDEMGLLDRVNNLIYEFEHFNCFLSKYYIEILQDIKTYVISTTDVLNKHALFTEYRKQTPSLVNYELAKKCLRDHPYVDVKDNRTLDANKCAEELKKHIDELGYDWKVQIDDNMIPRVCVTTDGFVKVNKTASFSEVDIESLKAHEIEGHVGRRFYGKKTGLYLFLTGLRWRNTLDEGLAIWNSIHKCNPPKPNVYFNIALKTIIAYQLDKKDFCELFDMVRELSKDIPDEAIFKTLVRYKRELRYCKLPGGNGDDMSYFCGYQIIKKMTDKERDDVLKYNIGPDQIPELPKIKLFLKLNKFDSLK